MCIYYLLPNDGSRQYDVQRRNNFSEVNEMNFRRHTSVFALNFTNKLCVLREVRIPGRSGFCRSYHHLNYDIGNWSYGKNNLVRELSILGGINRLNVWIQDLFGLSSRKFGQFVVGNIIGNSFSSKAPKGFGRFKGYEGTSNDNPGKMNSPTPPPFPNVDSSQIILIGCIVGLLMILATDMNKISNEVTYQEFLKKYLAEKKVERIQIVNKEFCRAILTESPTKDTSSLPALKHTSKYVSFKIGNIDTLEQRLEASQQDLGIDPKDFIPVQYIEEFNFGKELKGFVPTLLIFLIFSFLIQRINIKASGPGGIDKFIKIGRANTVTAKDVKSKVRFADVAGMREAKQEIMEFVDFLKNPKKYELVGARVPKGALLCGPPGTGKTLLAKAVAGEASVPFFTMAGSDFLEIFVGVGPSRVRDLFAQARKHAPSIIFIDEIDAVGRKRNKGGFAGGGNDERESTLNQLLVELDGFSKSTGVVVLAGTNRFDILDSALTRPGRFDRTVYIELPDLQEREEIFKVHLKPIRLSDTTDLDELSRRMASLCPGFAGAQIANVCNEAAILAARRNSTNGVDGTDFELATERVLGGLVRNNLMNEAQRKTVAVHEAGHALIGWLLPFADPVLKVSIVPRGGGALGFAQHLPPSVQLYSREELCDKLAVALGGRAAEVLCMKTISSGAADDLNKVTKLAYSFVSQLGMSEEVGLVSYGMDSDETGRFYRTHADQTALLIDTEVKNLISQQFQRVSDVLKENREKLDKLTEILFQKETIDYHDIVATIGERPFAMNPQLESFVRAKTKRKVLDEPSQQKEAEMCCDAEQQSKLTANC